MVPSVEPLRLGLYATGVAKYSDDGKLDRYKIDPETMQDTASCTTNNQ